MTLVATSRSQRWPKLREAVLYRGQTYSIAAMQRAPQRGLILRPANATDAAADLLLPFSEWRGFRWQREAARWERA